MKKLKADEGVNNSFVIEFFNLLIETTELIYDYSDTHTSPNHLPDLPFNSIDYIMGARNHLLWLEHGGEASVILSGYRTDVQYDDVNFKIYQLTRDFENWCKFLSKDEDVRKRLEKIYAKYELEPPTYGHFEKPHQKGGETE